jgi:type III secretory pathway component EscS
MSTWIKVARYQLLPPVNFVVVPLAVLAFAFAVNLIIASAEGAGPDPTKAVVSIFVVLFAVGVISATRQLPFGLALAVSRRSYYLGTVGLVVALAAVYGLLIAGLQALERATHQWGVGLQFFEVHYFLTGPWYLTWLSSFVGMALLFAYGLCFGLVYRRWDTIGLTVFGFGQLMVVLAGVLIADADHAWHRIGHFFAVLTAAGLTGVLAAVAAAIFAGGFALMRGVRV